jgi:hypothetical protein
MPKNPQAIGKNEIAAGTPAKSAQPAQVNTTSTAKPRSTFSQYLPTKEQEPALTGNNKVKSNNMER